MASRQTTCGALNDRQQRFVVEYLVDLNATQAAIRAGYSPRSARVQAAGLLANPNIQEAIRKANEKRIRRIEITGDRVLQELARIAFADITQALNDDGTPKALSEIDEDTRRALVGLETEERSDGEAAIRVRKLRLADKIRAAELLGKHLRLFVDRVELDDVSELTPEERARRAAMLLERAKARRDAAE